MLASQTGHELPYLLVGAFRHLIDELHRRLAEAGHPHLRPAHGLALQAINGRGRGITEIAETVGVSKQAMAKTVGRLQKLGDVERQVNSDDRRAHVITLSAHGHDALERSGEILRALAQSYADAVGEERLLSTVEVLRHIRADAPAFEQFERWFGETT